MSYIEDHKDEPAMRGRWRVPTCSRCGRPTREHRSFGESIAAKIGGHWRDYVDEAKP